MEIGIYLSIPQIISARKKVRSIIILVCKARDMCLELLLQRTYRINYINCILLLDKISMFITISKSVGKSSQYCDPVKVSRTFC